MRRLVVCLDGTWNNPYSEADRDDGTKVFRPSNVLKFCRAVKPRAEDGTFQLSYYDIGVGALNRYPGMSNRLLRGIDQKLGGAWGAGFEGHIESAYTFLALNYEACDEIYLVGFSRGAAEVRGLSRFIEWMGGFPQKNDAYYIPELFRRYLDNQGNVKFDDVLKDINMRRKEKEKTPRPPLEPFVPAKIRFLGVWETVMALGSRLHAHTGTSTSDRAFHAGESPTPIVRVARQALAIDERRYDFRPEIWTGAHDGQSMEQRWFAGAHSNVGGGYVHDGLADCALIWIAEEAKEAGLVLDKKYLSHFHRYPQDQLYDSRNLFYRIREAPVAWFRGETGRRDLLAVKESANLTLDKSVLDRLNANPTETNLSGEVKHPHLVLYRPDNLLRYLAAHPELDRELKPPALREVVELRKKK